MAQTDMLPKETPDRGKPEDRRKRERRDRRAGSLVIGLAFCSSLLINLAAKRHVERSMPPVPPPPTTDGIAGWPSAVDPVALLSRARQLSVRPLLRGFVATGVSEDGTIDARVTGNGIRYAFGSAREQGPPPPQGSGKRKARDYCGKQYVELASDGLGASRDAPTARCSGLGTEALPPPRCGLAQIWKSAIKRGAPTGELARIEYYRAKVGPAWRFELPSGFSRVFGPNCKSELKGNETRGSVR